MLRPRQPRPALEHASEAVAPDLFEYTEISPALREVLDTRVSDGQEEYGILLMTHNGRDVQMDLMDELSDAIFYAHQWGMENDREHPAFRPLIAIAENEVNK